MLDVRCQEYLEEVRKKANELGMRELLEEKLTYLDTFGCTVSVDGPPTKATVWERAEHPTCVERERSRCVLMKDHAPLSFYFELYSRGADGEYHFWFNGGMLWFSRGDTGVGSPQFSVRLDNSQSGWEIHT